MTDRLHDMLPQLEQLPSKTQEEIAASTARMLQSDFEIFELIQREMSVALSASLFENILRMQEEIAASTARMLQKVLEQRTQERLQHGILETQLTQEEVVSRVESFLKEALERTQQEISETQLSKAWKDPAGSCSDLPDMMLEDLDRLRHETAPTPPIEEL